MATKSEKSQFVTSMEHICDIPLPEEVFKHKMLNEERIEGRGWRSL